MDFAVLGGRGSGTGPQLLGFFTLSLNFSNKHYLICLSEIAIYCMKKNSQFHIFFSQKLSFPGLEGTFLF